MTCPKCGYANAADAAFCGLCYEVLRKAAPAPAKPQEERLAAGSAVLLGQPARYPEALAEALKTHLAGVPAVRAAYLAQIFVPSSGDPPHPVIGLELEPGADARAVIAAAAAAGEGSVPAGSPVTYLPIARDVVSEHLTSQTRPFYRRPA